MKKAFTSAVPAPPKPPAPPPCTDMPPDKQYTCAQQKGWGKCDTSKFPFMKGHCCRTCFNCAPNCGRVAATCRGASSLAVRLPESKKIKKPLKTTDVAAAEGQTQEQRLWLLDK